MAEQALQAVQERRYSASQVDWMVAAARKNAAVQTLDLVRQRLEAAGFDEAARFVWEMRL